ncbi:MAG: hypothetical protein B5M53_03130 [Candidatus Cloacimonas sp. 4484_209]|nr:MAG: hypothetical protein B5M53_03130 [Candidatus Cloacimonas sp. 4484_209]
MEKTEIERFRDGDKVLFHKIVDTYSERLYNIVYKILRNVDDTEDIVQETFVRAYTKRKGFKGKSSLYTWLVRIAYNLSYSFSKQKQPTVELDPRLKSNENPERYTERHEISNKIDSAIKSLPLKQRTVFSLRFYENLSYKEISNILKCRIGTAKALYHFAVERLSEDLKDIL